MLAPPVPPRRLARRRLPAPARSLAALLLLAAAHPARAGREIVYVALGGTVELPGGPRPGDPARIARRLDPARVRVVDLTTPGAAINDVLDEQLRRALALRPSLVTLAVGAADATGEVSLRSFSRDLQVVADQLRGTKALVVVSTLARAERLREGAGAGLRRRVDAFNWAIVRVARRHGFAVADVRGRGAERTWRSAVGEVVERALAPARPPAVEGAAAVRPRRAPRGLVAAPPRRSATRARGTPSAGSAPPPAARVATAGADARGRG